MASSKTPRGQRRAARVSTASGKSTKKRAVSESVRPHSEQSPSQELEPSEVRRLRVLHYSTPRTTQHVVNSISPPSAAPRAISATKRRSTPTASDMHAAVAHRSLGATQKTSVQHKSAEHGQPSRIKSAGQSQETSQSLSGIVESSTTTECDIVPDDSISVVARRRELRPRKSSASTSRHRSDLQRGDKINPVERQSSSTKPKNAGRERSLLDSLLRRNTSSTISVSPRLVECLTCGSEGMPSTKTAKLGCGHRMCNRCLKRIFELSITDPAHMPPRCCTADHIPLKHVERLFDLKFKITWNRKYQEYHTKNRVYCPAPKCGCWIKPVHIYTSKGRTQARCPKCATSVCTLCNHKMHKSGDCPEDPEIQKLIAQAKEKGWQSCYSCNALVELKEGCNHMTCRCLAEFCMLCGAKWKTCECSWFNYTQTTPGDQLLGMRVPQHNGEAVRHLPGERVPPAADHARSAEVVHTGPVRHLQTLHEDVERRRRQESEDERLARRLQSQMLLHQNDPVQDHRPNGNGPWGVGNAASHFMNDSYVQTAAAVTMSTFGDPTLGRRGTREAGRRRQAQPAGPSRLDPGLPANFLGDASVLGAVERSRSSGR